MFSTIELSENYDQPSLHLSFFHSFPLNETMPSSRESSSTTRTSYFGFTKGKTTASDTMSKDALSGAVKIIEVRKKRLLKEA